MLSLKMKVLKFGGTSVGSSESILKITEIVRQKSQTSKLVVVVSAFGGVTNQLVSCSELAARGSDAYLQIIKKIEEGSFQIVNELIPVIKQSSILADVKLLINELEDILQGVCLLQELTERASSYILSFGERISSFIIYHHFKNQGLPVALLDTRKVIITDSCFARASVKLKASEKAIRQALRANDITLAPGFIAANKAGITTTLGRGGSDHTAAVFAYAVNAEILEIWTDVNGMMTADPKKVVGALPIRNLSYKEALELSHFGAKVIYPPTIQPALGKNIPICIKNTFYPQAAGTYISHDTHNGEKAIKGISSIENITLLTIKGSGMVGVPGTAMRLFAALSQEAINIILITQASSEYAITLAIDSNDTKQAVVAIHKTFAQEFKQNKIGEVATLEKLSVVAIVGEGMRQQPGIAGKMLSILGRNSINVSAIAQASSERNISIVIEDKDAKKAINVLHESFFLSENRRIHIFLAGIGNVGRTLLRQIQSHQERLKKEYSIDIKICGLMNSRFMVFNESGIAPENWKQSIENSGIISEQQKFLKKIIAMNLRNAIFVDCTAEATITNLYEFFLSSSISVVTSNKIACSSAYHLYQRLKRTARKHNACFLFETNVGAGLPVISTLNDLVKSGDKIRRIEAVLSGTLNFIFNQFDARNRFSEVVRLAKERGYSEPDPREDLSGMDVMRKILILARESGATLEPEMVNIESFIPQECMKAESVEGFFSKLQKHDRGFEAKREAVETKKEKMCFMATYEEGKAYVKLQNVNATHPFYQLEGTDSIILFYTERYHTRPLVVKGAGAGADVTAAGVFADIIKTSNQ